MLEIMSKIGFGGKVEEKRNFPGSISLSYGHLPGMTFTETPEKALSVSAFYAACKIKADTLASTPVHVFRKDKNGIRYMAPDHDQQVRLSRNSSKYVKAWNFWRQVSLNIDFWGNAFAIIIRNKYGRPTEYILRKTINPFVLDGGLYYYDYEADAIYPAMDVLHFYDLGVNEFVGLSKIKLHKVTLGKTTAAQEYVNNVYTAGLFLGGVIEYPADIPPLSAEVRADISRTFQQSYGGLANAGKVVAIDQGGKFKSFDNTMPLSDFEYILSEQLSIEDIARITGVPPAKIFHYAKMNYNSIEHMDIDFAGTAMIPLFTQIEAELNFKIFRESEESNHFVKFNENAVLRADLQSQKEWFDSMFNIGVYSINEIRALKDMAPVDGGDIRFVEANNMLPLHLMEDYTKSKIDGNIKQMRGPIQGEE